MKTIDDTYLCSARDLATLAPYDNKIDYSVIAQVSTNDSEEYIIRLKGVKIRVHESFLRRERWSCLPYISEFQSKIVLQKLA